MHKVRHTSRQQPRHWAVMSSQHLPLLCPVCLLWREGASGYPDMLRRSASTFWLVVSAPPVVVVLWHTHTHVCMRLSSSPVRTPCTLPTCQQTAPPFQAALVVEPAPSVLHFWAFLWHWPAARLPTHPSASACTVKPSHAAHLARQRRCTCKQALHCVDGSTRRWGRCCATLQSAVPVCPTVKGVLDWGTGFWLRLGVAMHFPC